MFDHERQNLRLSWNRQVYDFFCLPVLYFLSFIRCLEFCFYNSKVTQTFLRKKLNAGIEMASLFPIIHLALNNIKSMFYEYNYIC